MTMVAVPTVFPVPAVKEIPPALSYMKKPGQINLSRLIPELDTCSANHHDCQNCPLRDSCYKAYARIVEHRGIQSWKGVNLNAH